MQSTPDMQTPVVSARIRPISSAGKKLAAFIVSHHKPWEYFCNGTLGLCTLLFDIRMIIDFRVTHRTSSLLLTIFETAIVFFSFTRPMPRESNTSLYDWTIALAGSFIIMLLRPAPQVHDNIILLAAQLLGMSVSLTALFNLNKSFGLVAANRGIKTSGMYCVVRHPIYAGYFLSFGAFLIQNPLLINAVIYASFVVLELLRMVAEERLLSGDPEYAGYTCRTRWRVLPLIY
jgi:protein-S-isoprenylcysteine O-methyltransferase Ste14